VFLESIEKESYTTRHKIFLLLALIKSEQKVTKLQKVTKKRCIFYENRAP